MGWPDQHAYFASAKRPGPLDCNVGDEVAYTVYFLRQVADGPTDPMCRARGRVTEVVDSDFVRVLWSNEAVPPRSLPHATLVNRCVLAKPGPNLRYCAD